MLNRRFTLAVGLVAMFGPAAVLAADTPASPAYQIVLRSRRAEVTPNRSKDAQTGGGSIAVEQPEPRTIVVTMGGSAVAGSECRASSAGIDFNLEQDLDIVLVGKGLRPPRIGMVGRVVGTLQVTDPSKCLIGGCKPCGTAEQGQAAASLSSGQTSLLAFNVQPSAASCGQELAINNREGPVESPAAVGSYRLAGTFHIGVTQGKGVWNRQAAVADFDPAPQLDAFWADVLKPFRAVPRKDFGFQVILRVVEDAGN
ncbi:MAG TPA: hypothetical protein VKE94_08820 [Gemmataceae bacterium]|nr:hypothetical protein [Gemmataceae bacterium]